MTSQRHARPTNWKSNSLNEEENEAVFSLLGNKCVTLATGVVQVYLADSGAKSRWNKRHCGVACFVKDNGKRSYYIRVFDIKKKTKLWDQEIYNQFKYSSPRPYFYTFEANTSEAGLNFANEGDAQQFKKVIDQKLLEKQRRKLEKRRQTTNVAPPSLRGPALNSPNQSLSPVKDFAPKADNNTINKKEKKDGKKDKNKSKKLTKQDIGTPSDFRHVGHVGWDPNKGFDMKNLEPTMKTVFQSVGFDEEANVDKETFDFIYDFVEQHGGIDAVQKDIASRPPPPPAHNPPSVGGPRRTGPLPQVPQPNRGVPLPPPPAAPHVLPSRGPTTPTRLKMPPPPPPSRSMPPPPPVPGGLPPPPPPMAPPAPPLAPALPPPSMGAPPPAPGMGGRGGLLSEIHQGKSLSPVTQNERPPAQEDSRGDLLSQIRLGTKLTPVEQEERDSRHSSQLQQGGIVGALAQALAKRQEQIQGSDDDDNDDDDDLDEDDDDWDD